MLKILGQTAKLFNTLGDEMETVRIKAEKFLFEQSKKSGLVVIDDKLDPNIVYWS